MSSVACFLLEILSCCVNKINSERYTWIRPVIYGDMGLLELTEAHPIQITVSLCLVISRENKYSTSPERIVGLNRAQRLAEGLTGLIQRQEIHFKSASDC